MKKIIALITMLVVMFAVPASSHAEVVQFSKTPVIGIAWRADTDSEFFTNICKTVEAAGASWVMLDQVKTPGSGI